MLQEKRTLYFRSSAFTALVGLLAISPLLSAQPSAQSISCEKARKLADKIGKSVVNLQIVKKKGAGRIVSLASFSGFLWAPPKGSASKVAEREKGLSWIASCCPLVFNMALSSGEGSILEDKDNFVIATFDNLARRTCRLWGFDPCTGVSLFTCRNVPTGTGKISLSPAASLRRGTCVLTVANPSGLDHSTRYGFAVAPVLVGHPSRFLAYSLDLEYVRGHEGALAYVYGKGFAGVVLPGSVDTEDRFLASAFPKTKTVRTAVLPTQSVAAILKCLYERKPIRRGWVGLRLKTVQLGEKRNAVEITDVAQGSPASKVGLEKGEVIVEINGKPIKSLDDLYEIGLWVEFRGIGKKLSFKVLSKSGQTREVTVTVGERPLRVKNYR